MDADGYAPPEIRPPLAYYTAFAAIFNLLFAGGLFAAKANWSGRLYECL